MTLTVSEVQNAEGSIQALAAAEIRDRIRAIEQQRTSRDEPVSEARGLLAAAERELADLEDRQVRAGENVAKEIGKVEAQIAQLGRQLRAQATARDRVYDETAPEHSALAAALPIAEHRELESAADAELALANAAWDAAYRRQIEALAELSQADAAMRDARSVLFAAAGSASTKLGRRVGPAQVDLPQFAPDFTTMDRLHADPRLRVAGIRLDLDRDRMTWSTRVIQ